MSPQKLYCFIVYLLEDEQELSLGMLILYQLLHVLHPLYVTFIHFFGTNLLTRCHSASSCFLLFLYSRKASQEIFSELDENLRRHLFYQDTHGVQRRER